MKRYRYQWSLHLLLISVTIFETWAQIGNTSTPIDCVSLPETGPCKADVTHWNYNPKVGLCLPFVYGGCGGNGNNYYSKAECTKACRSELCDPSKQTCVQVRCPSRKKTGPYVLIPKSTRFTYFGCCKGKLFKRKDNFCRFNGPTPCKFYGSTRCGNGNCMLLTWNCDGYNDCSDGSDEKGCGTCPSNKFKCRTGNCISMSKVCDGRLDCSDGIDESNCATKSGGWCGKVRFRCKNSKCIPLANVCNKKDDCGDGSDEQCQGTKPTQKPPNTTPRPPPSGTCGQPAFPPSTRGRVVGGIPAREHSWPWQISLLKRGKHHCGGSLINPQWVVTAAHCTDDFYGDPSRAMIIVGQHKRKGKPTPFQKRIKVLKIIERKDYNRPTRYNNDLALLKLAEKVKFRKEISAVCLPKQDDTFSTNLICYTTGWGARRFMGPPSNELLQVKVPIVDYNKCNGRGWYNGRLTTNMICAGFEAGGKDSCQGDSGGPFVCKRGITWYLAGVVSWGEGCAKPRRPGLYTKVAKYIDWINEQIAKN